MRPLHIAFVGQRGVPATFGGIEHHVEELGARLVARGHRVTVFTRPRYAPQRIPEHRGMQLRYLPAVPTKRLEALTHSGLSTLAAMVAAQPRVDVIHFHAIGPSVFSPLPRSLTRRRVVLTLHGLDYDRDKWGSGARVALRAAAWVSARVPHATISVSRSLVAHYRDHYDRAVDYIPNGVNAPVRREPREITARWGLRGNDYVLFLGRLVPEKAPDLLIRAFSRVQSPARLVIAGGSSFTDGYVRRLEQLAAADPRVLLAGPVYGGVRDELYTSAAAFVLPSSLEGLPLTLLEAASFRVPIIASAIAPNVEVLSADQPGGRLFPAGDEAELADRLRTVLDDLPGERAGARLIGDAVVREYDWDRAADLLEDVYARITVSRGALEPALGEPDGTLI